MPALASKPLTQRERERERERERGGGGGGGEKDVSHVTGTRES